MKKLFLLIATVLLALTSCTEENAVNNSVVPGKIQASFEESISRLSIGEGNSLAWSTGDAFTMCNDAGGGSVWTLEGSGGDVNGVFSGLVPEGTLKGAAFPATSSSACVADNLVMLLPTELTYEAGICNLPMWASFSSLEETISFKHLGALLKINFADIPEGYSSLVVTADRPISGGFIADLSASEPVLEATENGVNYVKVSFLAISGDDNDRLFYLPLPVGTYGSLNVSISDGTNTLSIADWSNRTIVRKKVYVASLSYRVSDAKTPTEITEELDDMMEVTSNASVDITNEIDASKGSIVIPAEASKIDLNFEQLPVTTSSTPLKIEEEPETTKSTQLIVSLPASTEETYMEFNTPTTTVNVEGGNYKKIVARTASNTLVLGQNTMVEDLVVLAGNVVLEGGKVTGSITRDASNTDAVTSLYVEDKKQLEGVTIGEGIKVVDNIPADYVTFIADSEQTFRMTKAVETLEYSVNDGLWNELGTNTITFGGDKGTLRLRGKSAMGTAASLFDNSQIIIGNKDVPVACTGNILTLVDYENYEDETLDTSNARFCYLFANFLGSLISAPKLPAMVLADDCYSMMFARCTNLAVAPELPATTLAKYCYYNMFQGCKSLTASPVLPAFVLVEGCYGGMFSACSSLSSVTMLAAHVSANFCLDSWLNNVSANGTFIKHSSVTNTSAFRIPSGWEVKDYEGTGGDSSGGDSDNDTEIEPGNSCQIKYTSTDGKFVVPNSNTFGESQIISHTYTDGVGIIEFDKPVSSIVASAFYGRTNLKRIALPEDVVVIKGHAFYGCTSLVNVSLGSSLTELAFEVFKDCQSLTKLEIPQSTIKIGQNIVSGCTALESIVFPEKVEFIDVQRFTESQIVRMTLPVGTQSIDGDAFRNCKLLEEIVIPETVAEIGNRAFEGCSSLVKVEIPDQVTKIGYRTFADCALLTDIRLGTSLTELGYNVFLNCKSLTKLEIPQSTSKIGDGIVSGCTALESIVFPDKVEQIGRQGFGDSKISRIVLPYGIELIGNRDFKNCKLLKEVILPETVTWIDEGAFEYCILLESIDIPDSVEKISNFVFHGCTALTYVNLSSSLTELGNEVFDGCESLIKLEIPQSTTKIGNNIVRNCINLESIVFPDVVETIGEQQFFRSKVVNVALPIGTKVIPNDAFNNCKLLQSVTIPSGVTLIGDYSFTDCISLVKIVLPSTVSSIGKWAFLNSSLSEITLGDGINYIDEWAFRGTSIQEISIPDGLKVIKDGTFADCKSLTSIDLGNGVETIERCAFGSSNLKVLDIPENVKYIGDDILGGCTNLETVIFPEKVESMGYLNLRENRNLKKVRLPQGQTTIEKDAFYDCNSLVDITIPSSVISIGDHAFENCSSLIEIKIPDGVTTIGNSVFWRCSSLIKVILPNNLTTIGDNPFNISI